MSSHRAVTVALTILPSCGQALCSRVRQSIHRHKRRREIHGPASPARVITRGRDKAADEGKRLIDTNGIVRSAKVLRSIPLLDAAAIEAVKGWRYMPSTRDGVAVPILMTVTVNFTIQ